MTKSLTQIISDGTLVDNSLYQSHDGRFGDRNGQSVEITQGGRARNNPWTAWTLLQKAAALDTRTFNLVFRTLDAEYEHNTRDPLISISGSDPYNFQLATGNLIGSVTSEKCTVRISSRFGDDFLKYIIAEADGFVELPDHGGVQDGGYEWLLVYLWVIKLRGAFRLGLPKIYETRTEDLHLVRGRVDPIDYFANHGRAIYRCTYREHSYDNAATRLIARTLEHLNSHHFLRESQTLFQTFEVATSGRRSSIQDLLSTSPLRNPYFAAYNPVITLSKRILRDAFSDFGDQSPTSAFLFDISMLFEYFVMKLLKRAGACFYPKTTHRWRIPSGVAHYHRRLIPDLVFEINGEAYLFDVKYKRFNFSDGIIREDLFQLHTYIGQLSNEMTLAGCGFIYPISDSNWNAANLDAIQGICSELITQNRQIVPFHTVFLKIPDGLTNFSHRFTRNINTFIDLFISRITAHSMAVV